MPDIRDDEQTALLTTSADSQDDFEGSNHEFTECYSSTALNDRPARKPFPWRVAISLYLLTCIAPLAFELIFPFVSE